MCLFRSVMSVQESVMSQFRGSVVCLFGSVISVQGVCRVCHESVMCLFRGVS